MLVDGNGGFFGSREAFFQDPQQPADRIATRKQPTLCGYDPASHDASLQRSHACFYMEGVSERN